MNTKKLNDLITICDYLALDSIKTACERQLAFDFIQGSLAMDVTATILENSVNEGATIIENFFLSHEVKNDIAVLICVKFLDNTIKKLNIDLDHPEKLSGKIRDYKKSLN